MNDGEELHYCKRFPPQVQLTPVRTLAGDQLVPIGYFPQTRPDLWCGEHKAQNKIVS